MDAWGPLAGLFVSAFTSATILPGSSEVALAALLAWRGDLAVPALALATVGNTAGAMTSYTIGRLLPERVVHKLSPRVVDQLRRRGTVALLLSWVPLAGDALCVASGWLRQDWRWALAMIAAGKFARYLAIVVAVDRFSS